MEMSKIKLQIKWIMIHQPMQYYVGVAKTVIMKTMKKLGEMFMNIITSQQLQLKN